MAEEDVQFNNVFDAPDDTDNQIPAAESIGKEPGKTTTGATDHDTSPANSIGKEPGKTTTGNDVTQLIATTGNVIPNPCEDAAIFNKSQQDSPVDSSAGSPQISKSGGPQHVETSDSSVSNEFNESSQEEKSESNISSKSDESWQHAESESGICGKALPYGPEHNTKSEMTPLADFERAKEDKTLESTVSIEHIKTPDGKASETLKERENVETPDGQASERLKERENVETPDGQASERLKEKENVETPDGQASETLKERENLETSDGQASDTLKGRENVETPDGQASETLKEKENVETPDGQASKTLEERKNVETREGQATETLKENENDETPEDKSAESISRDEQNRPLHDARTFKFPTQSKNERNPESAASMPHFSGVREDGVMVKKDADDITDRLYHEKVIREIQSLKDENSEFEMCCKKWEQIVDASFSKLKETGISQKTEEELYNSLQDEIRKYGMHCDVESGKVFVLAKNVKVIIEETTVGLEVTPASINTLEQELTMLTKLTENKKEQHNNYLKLLKDHDSNMRLSFAEKETQLRKELESLKAEMIGKDNNFAEKKGKLEKELAILKAKMVDTKNSLTDMRSKLSEQEKNLQYFETKFNESKVKRKEQKQAMKNMSQALDEMGAKDIRNQGKIHDLEEQLKQQQDDINKLQKMEADANHYYNQWQRYSREFEHSAQQLRDSREARHQLEQEKKDLVLRLSKIAGANLTYNNPNIADLGDPNRPTKLAEVFSEIYDNEWTDAYETVMDDEEKNKIQFMLKILKDVDTICENVTKRHADAITDGLTQMVVRFKVRKGPTDPKRESDERALKRVDTHIESPASTKDVLATVKFGNPSAVNKPIKHCVNEPSTSNKSDGEQGDALATHENLAKENKGTSPSQSENGNKVNQSEAGEKVTSDSNKTDRNQIDKTATEKNTSRNNANINTTQIENENKENHLEPGEKKTSDSNKTDEAATNDKPPTANANIDTTQSENGAQDKRLEPADKDSSTSKSTDGKHADEKVTHQKQHSIIESKNSIQSENGAKKYQLESGERESSTSNKTKGEHTDETPSDEKSTSENKSTNSVQSKNVVKDNQLEPGENESFAPNNTDGEKNADSIPDEKNPTDNANFNCMENKKEDNMSVLCDKNKSTSNKSDDELGDKADTKHLLENEIINLLQTKSEDGENKIYTSTIKHDLCFLGVCVVEVDSKHREGKDEEVVTDTTTANTEQEDTAYMEMEKGDGAFGKSAVIQNNGHNEQKHTKKEAEEEGKDGVVDKDTTPANTEQEDADYIEKVEYEERSEIIQIKFDELATAQKQYIEDIRRRVQSDLAEQVIMAICNAVLEEMGPNQADEIRNYISKCSLFCWTARLHNPPVYVDFMEVTENMRFDMSVYKPYTKTGPLVDYIVWPPIYLHKGGPMLSKGVAEGKKNN
ncbi:myosin-2 heavy chain-like isoform X2 [Mya arenaria]|uniref:myosin-2 heavy chain-like isoform X2 n=1 Tax=Mya arenaria TaxID=6604 RepID=UPI0022E408A7|nr:myosin-2 heavy chain-like isoform X2 [Mya arenaria]